MRKIVFLVMMTVFISGCSKQEEIDVKNVETSSTTITNTTEISRENKREKYMQILNKAYEEQKDYVDSLKKDVQNSVQSPISAVIAKGEELILDNPQDRSIIEELVSHINGVVIEERESVKIENSNHEKLIVEYSNKVGKNFEEATPATYKKYYNLAVPDEALAKVYYEDKQIAFVVSDSSLKFGLGEEYKLFAIYVSEQQDELIIFAQIAGEKIVFQSKEKPIDNKVILVESQDDILNEY